MSFQLRVSRPDQPGALSTVAQAIARAGADVIAVSVRESDAGRALDEFRLRWPDGRAEEPLLDAVGKLMGVQVVACRRTPWLLDGRPDLDLLAVASMRSVNRASCASRFSALTGRWWNGTSYDAVRLFRSEWLETTAAISAGR